MHQAIIRRSCSFFITTRLASSSEKVHNPLRSTTTALVPAHFVLVIRIREALVVLLQHNAVRLASTAGGHSAVIVALRVRKV